MYIKREIESTIDTMLTQGKVVLVTGARQVGKTTTLKHHLCDSFDYVSMENPREYSLAKQDAVLFFESKNLPLIIDEIQRAPELFSPVKWIVDQSDEKGRIVLTGSQTYHLMKGVSESLAGRVRILEMPSLNLREIMNNANNPHPYTPTKTTTKTLVKPVSANEFKKDALSNSEQAERHASQQRRESTKQFASSQSKEAKGLTLQQTNRSSKSITSSTTSDLDIWSIIHRGSMPELQDSSVDWESFYTNYESAYLERDVRDLINVKDEAKFYNFMVACAARSGQLFNASEIGNVVGIDYKTVQSWLSVLQASNIVRILEPFWPNIDKRLSKMPKIFFMDTGLLCHLTRWTTPDQLKNGAVAGHVFETFVVSEILKSYMNAGANLRDVWFYRDSKKREIDLLIQNGHVLHPVEIKMAATVSAEAIKNFACLEKLSDYEVGFGHVVCQTREVYPITSNVQAVPVWAI